MRKLIISLLVILVVGACAMFFTTQNTTDNSIDITTTTSTTEEEIVVLPNKSLSFVAVGDNLIHGAVYHYAKTGNNTYDFKPIYSDIKPFIKGNDIAFINQETIIGGKEMGLSHYPLFNSPEEVVEAISDVGFNLVNTATNHSLDKGFTGIKNALNTFDQYPNLVVSGINRSQEEQDTIRILNVQDLNIAFLAYTGSTNGLKPLYDFEVNMINESRIRNDIARAKEISDIIIVSMHWGNENSNQVNDYQRKYAALLNGLGVNIIIGTHPHVIQSVELMKRDDGFETLVMYSLGNFLSAQDIENNLLEGMVGANVIYNPNDGSVTFEDITFTALIDHFDRGFTNFKVIRMADYSKEMENKNGLGISIDRMRKIVEKVITDENVEIIY